MATCCRQYVSCIGNKIVASLLPVCCWIQRDTSRPWHKWIVMSPRYSQQSTCIPNKQLVAGQHDIVSVNIIICIRIQVARPGNMLPGNMLPWCKPGLTVTELSDTDHACRVRPCATVRARCYKWAWPWPAGCTCTASVTDVATLGLISTWRFYCDAIPCCLTYLKWQFLYKIWDITDFM